MVLPELYRGYYQNLCVLLEKEGEDAVTDIPKLLEQINCEYENAKAQFPCCHSYHEGYAVLLEEVDELWDAIKNKMFSPLDIYFEARQVAAMALDIMVRAKTEMDEEGSG